MFAAHCALGRAGLRTHESWFCGADHTWASMQSKVILPGILHKIPGCSNRTFASLKSTAPSSPHSFPSLPCQLMCGRDPGMSLNLLVSR